MSEMVERVAKAICQKSMEELNVTLSAIEPPHLAYMDQARAAISAMREPTDPMVEAACNLDEQGSSIYREPFIACSHEEAWRAMIDAALK